MQKFKAFILFFITCALHHVNVHAQQYNIQPRIVHNHGVTQLFIDGKPFLILGGELGNSTSSNINYMRPVWRKLKSMHLNTVLAPVYWELLEPAEGKFDFTLVDSMMAEARKEDLKLIMLWFGSWKNSMSCFAPE